MAPDPTRSSPDRNGWMLLGLGMLLWVGVLARWWPMSLSMGDEVGYVGQARLLLQGRIMPLETSPGYWVSTLHGLIPKYPLFFPMLIAPLLALSPRLLFASGVLAALALAWTSAGALAAWGRRPFWALILLAHPTIIMIARTVMADVLLTAFAVGAWRSLRHGKPWLVAVLVALTIVAKPTGIPIAVALLVGEALRRRAERSPREPSALARLQWGGFGLAAGLALTVGFNWLETGTIFSPYGAAHQYLRTPQFWPVYFPAKALIHVRTLLLMPPLLALGALPLARRREVGPLLVIVGLTLMMCFYFFVDRGPSLFESLVLAPRLILPAVAFLLIGYADGLSGWLGRRPFFEHLAPVLLVILPAVVALPLSIRHRRWQEPGAAALRAASDAVSRRHGHELGVGQNAAKAALLYDGRSVESGRGTGGPDVILCSTRSASYRRPSDGGSCALDGYDDQPLDGGFHLLTRRRSPSGDVDESSDAL